MTPSWGTVSFLEGVRLALALVGVAASLWAVTHAGDGSLAFASPIRGRMIWRRRWQMIGNLAIFLTLGAQTFSAALVPDPPVISTAGMAVSYAVITVLSILVTMTLMFSIGWAGVQEVLGRTPLVLTAAEQTVETALIGRRVVHDINGDLGLLVGEIEILAADSSISVVHRAAIVRMSASAEAVRLGVIEVQRLMRSMSPQVPPAMASEVQS